MTRSARSLLVVLLVAVVIVVLFNWVFPWVEQQQQDPTIGVVQVLRSAR